MDFWGGKGGGIEAFLSPGESISNELHLARHCTKNGLERLQPLLHHVVGNRPDWFDRGSRAASTHDYVTSSLLALIL